MVGRNRNTNGGSSPGGEFLVVCIGSPKPNKVEEALQGNLGSQCRETSPPGVVMSGARECTPLASVPWI